MNQIIEILAAYFIRGEAVKRVSVDNKIDPKALVVYLENDEVNSHPIDVENREEFMSQWKQAGIWWRFQWDDFK